MLAAGSGHGVNLALSMLIRSSASQRRSLSSLSHPPEKKNKIEGEMCVCPSATSILHHHHHLFFFCLILLGEGP
jgi:hypothetical protein